MQRAAALDGSVAEREFNALKGRGRCLAHPDVQITRALGRKVAGPSIQIETNPCPCRGQEAKKL